MAGVLPNVDLNGISRRLIHQGYQDFQPWLPSGKHRKKRWKDPPFYKWVNPLFLLGHVQVRKV